MATASANSLKSIIVTGANCGIGYSVAYKLCSDGYDVILACRSKEKAEQALSSIKSSQPSAQATFLQIDLCDFKSVRAFVENYRKLDKKLYALINNAGVVYPFADTNRHTTDSGLELAMAANYYGHFLLTKLLLEDLKNGAKEFGESRVVAVASSLHCPKAAQSSLRGKPFDIKEIEFDNMEMEKEGTYCGIQAYKNSKSAVIMSMYELANQLQGTGVTANSVCPGFIPTTNLSRNNGRVATFFMQYILPTIAYITGKKFVISLEEGCRRVSELATSEEFKGVSGKYYQDGKESESQGDTQDKDKQKLLWQKTEEIVGLSAGDV